MRLLDISFEDPAQNLSLDEVLLDSVEAGQSDEVIRFWESGTYFVVLGVSQVLRQEIREPVCLEDGVPILRRSSGGGCVLQGPGCLNYSLVLKRRDNPDLHTVRSSYCYILGEVRKALATIGLQVRHKGTSDLALGTKKVSGNAQKRRRESVLHHGTILYGMDVQRIARYLREPVERPQYRGARGHRGFIRNLEADPDQVRQAIASRFGAEGPAEKPRAAEVQASKRLAKERYASEAWIHRR